MTDDFSTTLRRYRLRSGLSQNALAKIVGINASYINRLESGEREAPTREVAHALARALTLATEETDRLLFSAGHVPPTLQKLGPSDSTVAAVTRLLTNDRLSPEARADFRAVVETIAIRWQCNQPSTGAHHVRELPNRTQARPAATAVAMASPSAALNAVGSSR